MPSPFFKNNLRLLTTIYLKKPFFTIILCVGFICVNAQLNLKIGYTLDYINQKPLNRIFNEYNVANPWLEKELSDVHFSNGIQFGFRLKRNFVAIDGHWERIKNSKEISGTNLESNIINENIEFSYNRFAIGLEGYNKYFGFGVNVNYLRFGVNSISEGNDQNILKDNAFGNKVYLIISSQGSNRMGMSLQPYVQIPWKPLDITHVNSYLQPNLSTEVIFTKNYHFGISLIFYNGPQDN